MGDSLSVVIVDNFDSFTWNLSEEFARLGAVVEAWRNDAAPERVMARVTGRGPGLLVLSPGPGTPAEAGCCTELVRRAEQGGIPLLGVCLGLQVMVEALGGRVRRAGVPVHGRASKLTHDGGPPFEGLPSPLLAGRYHSLAAVSLPGALEPAARAGDVVMAVRHRSARMLGVQFHPESILTPDGGRLIGNVMEWTRRVAR